jgi:hypothetical protein
VAEVADIRPYGGLDPARLAMLESGLGRPLPPVYRAWLTATNGAYIVGEHGIHGCPFVLFEERPLFGVHAHFRPFDLLAADGLYRRPWLSTDYLVVAAPSGGLVVVRVSAPTADTVFFLPEDAMTGQPGAAADAVRERHLVPLADDVNDFGHQLRRLA